MMSQIVALTLHRVTSEPNKSRSRFHYLPVLWYHPPLMPGLFVCLCLWWFSLEGMTVSQECGSECQLLIEVLD